MRQTHHQRKEIKPNRPLNQSGKQSKKAQLQDAGKCLQAITSQQMTQ
jgi:hypothetical protein